MISVGIDVAKGKSTVCILKPYGEIVSKPFDIAHIEKDLSELTSMLLHQGYRKCSWRRDYQNSSSQLPRHRQIQSV